MGEETKNALQREFRKKMSIAITVHRLLWTEECFWRWGSRQAHTFTFYYLIDSDLPLFPAFVPQRDNENVLYCRMHHNTVYPAFPADHVDLLNESPLHLITHDT